jgi:hypothetical protein
VILFFGTRLRRTVLGTGAFHCPYCQLARTYEHAESRTWAHVFWIPLFPMGGPFESIRCTACGSEYAPSVLAGSEVQDTI